MGFAKPGERIWILANTITKEVGHLRTVSPVESNGLSSHSLRLAASVSTYFRLLISMGRANGVFYCCAQDSSSL